MSTETWLLIIALLLIVVYVIAFFTDPRNARRTRYERRRK